ncbi:hypothetical protein HPB49_018387 [Dermacentor silvarum]|uniref:Uncharacterized protein n=1 Tax=Dermacentor silvarum TaxID=543639 RepID=A0ACB8E2H5_DERSI|nr:hypothetical protein HPB49_018387 [Dermacentor silvarum]
MSDSDARTTFSKHRECVAAQDVAAVLDDGLKAVFCAACAHFVMHCPNLVYEASSRLTWTTGTSQPPAKFAHLILAQWCSIREPVDDQGQRRRCERSVGNTREYLTYIPRCREDIVSAINRNRVLVICGETGSGKTKQAAQFIFEDYNRGGQGSRCNIVVTQPRRIAAISMAKRAALERHNELSHTFSFQVRLTKQLLTSRGGILFCTVGILVRHWQQNGELVDEVHERDVSTDFLLVRCSPSTAH